MGKHEEHFMLDGVEVKRCCDCGRVLPVTMNYYFKDSSAWDGIMHSCRECRGYKFKPIVKEGYKICNKCGRELEICPKNFTKESQLKDGHSGTCRECKGIIDPPEGFAFCNKCGKELPHTDEYFKRDKKCHDGLTGTCRVCIAEQRKQYYAENSDWIYEKQKQYKQIHKEEYRVYYCKYRKNHPNILSEQQIANKRLSDKKYYQTHKEVYLFYSHKYKARKRQLPNTLTESQWLNIKSYFHNKCAYCGKEIPLTQEHFIPVSKGGEYTHNNILPACQSCNSSKGNRNFFIWYPKYKFYSKKREKQILTFLGYKGEIQQLALM